MPSLFRHYLKYWKRAAHHCVLPLSRDVIRNVTAIRNVTHTAHVTTVINISRCIVSRELSPADERERERSNARNGWYFYALMHSGNGSGSPKFAAYYQTKALVNRDVWYSVRLSNAQSLIHPTRPNRILSNTYPRPLDVFLIFIRGPVYGNAFRSGATGRRYLTAALFNGRRVIFFTWVRRAMSTAKNVRTEWDDCLQWLRYRESREEREGGGEGNPVPAVR